MFYESYTAFKVIFKHVKQNKITYCQVKYEFNCKIQNMIYSDA